VTQPLDTDTLFDREMERYDAAHDRYDAAVNALHIRMAVTLRLLGSRPGTVLDCGMGPGRLLVELERRGWSIAGIDVSGAMVALARSRLPGSAERLHQAPVESLPFASESFDAAVATGVFEYVEDLPRALAEVARVLRPGGLFVISMPNTRALGTLWRHRVGYRAVRALKTRLGVSRRMPLPRPGLVSLPRLKELLEDAAFETEKVEYMTLVPRPVRALFPGVAVRFARRLARVGPGLGSVIGPQYVVAARKADPIAS
jgi:ubiquinone/menaquinone biosynthesis C-methylase UbiE